MYPLMFNAHQSAEGVLSVLADLDRETLNTHTPTGTDSNPLQTKGCSA